ncbi:uncharacterized protein Gr47a [Drosophila bipectinata]|uniref:uncharacterized protein Gr47a n=1 Tax=Drosophila bipectinata TaxID=42026 RepID=UPI001C8AA993|nr:uncharacterized protein LOC108118709 [Drosophila bipectinata]
MPLLGVHYYSFLTYLTGLNGLNTYYFVGESNRFRNSTKLKLYCFMHHLLCGLGLAIMLNSSWGNVRICVTLLTIGATCVFAINNCWEKTQGIRKLAEGLVRLETKHFAGKPSGFALKVRCYMKQVLVVVTLVRVIVFYPLYIKRFIRHFFILNVACYWLLYNMLLSAVFGFYCLVWQICRSQKLINDRMTKLLTKSRIRNRSSKMRRCLKLYSKLLGLCNSLNYEFGHISICVLACKSWFQITYGYEIFIMIAAPRAIDLSLPLRMFVVLTYVLDAVNLYFATDVAELFTRLREDSLCILRESNRLDPLLSMFTLKLALHRKRVVFLNAVSFDRKLTLTLMAKTLLYTVCWLQGDYKKLVH